MGKHDGSNSGIKLSERSQVKSKYVIAGHDNTVKISETTSVARERILDDEDISAKTEALKTAVATGGGAAGSPEEVQNGLTAVLDELGSDAPSESRIVDRLDLLTKAAGAVPTILTAVEALKSAIQGWSWPS